MDIENWSDPVNSEYKTEGIELPSSKSSIWRCFNEIYEPTNFHLKICFNENAVWYCDFDYLACYN